MNPKTSILLLLTAALSLGCAELQSLGGSKYGDTSGALAGQTDREGTVTTLEVIKVDEDFKLGVGTAMGAVAGGILGSQIGSGSGSTVAGAAVGAAAGTYAESKLKKKDAQRVVVQMKTGGQLTIVQPIDGRLKSGMNVRIDGSGDSARVLPR
ncbi:glycine zipper 2TM domain-containing protein [Rhodoferax sp.]|uniref:glycine zipper 2TM domain-containing protein n=1 Tax=Rhodoferax sp. TaxID=50421 RepID=UPI001ECEC6B4|nr:glycine zipper 2TM domain-containing protein [Rhodoferax sp.]MBT9507032.1 glycine zipper 2TM domain-containing protein [Rhodoferax sp.]